MRMVLVGNGAFTPTEGAIVPELFKAGAEAAQDTAADVITALFLKWSTATIQFMTTHGLTIIAEFALCYALFCFCAAITGKGKWMERGLVSILISVMAGVGKSVI